jgi:hypothetical protein
MIENADLAYIVFSFSSLYVLFGAVWHGTTVTVMLRRGRYQYLGTIWYLTSAYDTGTHLPVLWIRMWIRIQGFDDQKLKEHFFISFFEQNCNLLIPSGRLSNRRSLQPSKEKIQHLKKMKFLNCFSIFTGHFCHPRSGFGSNPYTDPYPDP